MNADDFEPSQIPRDAFVVYQGHHGDAGAQFADVVLPGSAYTEKSVTWVNTEGRSQLGRAAVGPPGASREDWKIVRALSEVLGSRLPYDDVNQLRERMWDVSPTLVKYDVVERPSSVLSAIQALKAEAAHSAKQGKVEGARTGKFLKPIENFYRTDPISRSSVTMSKCTVSDRGARFELCEPQLTLIYLGTCRGRLSRARPRSTRMSRACLTLHVAATSPTPTSKRLLVELRSNGV